MRKITGLLFSLLLIFSCVLVGCGDTKNEKTEIDQLLAPYQEVIDKVNREVEPDFYIPEAEKENVYNYYKEMTTAEFEQRLWELYESTAEENFEGEYTILSPDEMEKLLE